MKIKVGTRRSSLALAQTKLACDWLEGHLFDLETETIEISTRGDKDRLTPLYQMTASGVFVKTIEEELLAGNIDMAIHSLKDLPSILDDRLCLLPFVLFEDKRDILLSKHGPLENLPYGARVGTSSLRRQGCLKKMRPDLVFVNLRGNIDSRIDQWKNSSLDAIIIAAAGLRRLSYRPIQAYPLSFQEVIPACGQGTLAMEIRKEDLSFYMPYFSSSIQDQEVQWERKFLQKMQAGCKEAIGCVCSIEHEILSIQACYGKNADTMKLERWEGPASQGEKALEILCASLKGEKI